MTFAQRKGLSIKEIKMTFTEAWNEKWQEFVDGEKGVARVMEHRTIDADTEIYCLAMEDKGYQVRIYSKGKMKIDSKHEKSTEAIAAYRVIRDDMKPAPNKPKAEKKAKAEKKPATKKAAAKKPAKKAKKASGKAKSKEPVAPEDGFWDDNE